MRSVVAVGMVAGIVVGLAALFVILMSEKSTDSSAAPATSSGEAEQLAITAAESASQALTPSLQSQSWSSSEAGLEIGLQDLSGLQSGDTLSLSIPQEARDISGTVTRVSISAAGNRTLHGNLSDPLQNEQQYPFVFTIGQRYTFGTIQTSLNRYQLEVRDGLGRMVAATSLKKDIDYSQPDYVIPERRSVDP